jgi:hypothetical protein
MGEKINTETDRQIADKNRDSPQIVFITYVAGSPRGGDEA